MFHLPECPRWHDDVLWHVDMWGHTVYRDGKPFHRFPTDEEPGGLGWLPDGRLLVVGMEGRCVYRFDGDEPVVHADLRELAPYQCNDMVVDADGTAYVTQFGFDMWNRQAVQPSPIIRVSPDGEISVAADDLMVPNGIAISDDRVVVAEPGAGRISVFDRDFTNRRLIDLDGGVPDGLCLDAEGGIWYADPVNCRVVHLPDQRTIDLDGLFALAVVLGGPDRRTLFVCATAHRHKPTAPPEPTGRVLTFEADVPGEGRP